MDSKTLQLHDCLISRRGKAAKGFVAVKTFGIPNPPRKNRKGEYAHDPKVTKTFNYDAVVDLHFDKTEYEFYRMLMDASNFNKRLMMKSAIMGVDKVNMSQAIQAQSNISQIANVLIANELVCDAAEAKSVAKEFDLWCAMCAKRLKPVPTIDDLLDERRKVVADLKAKNLWNPKLVKPIEMESEDEDSDDLDSDDSESDDE